MQYFFELGNHPELSRAEIEHVFFAQKLSWSVVRHTKEIFIIETTDLLDAPQLMHTLGGCKKIGVCVGTEATTDDLANVIEKTQSDGKIQFSLSPKQHKKQALELKKLLKSRGRSVRYIEPKNSATILHNNLIEKQGDFTLLPEGVFVTVAIQPIEALGKRDYERPGRDSVSGMLPPKLAQIMINLAQVPKQETLLDPFCGSGTVLMEALLMGYTHVIGTDLSAKAIADTKKNVAWIQSEYAIQEIHTTISLQDVRSLANTVKENSVAGIVSEPYMGKPLRASTSIAAQEKQVRELRSLYLDAFKSFSRVLKTHGIVVMIIPKFFVQKKWLTIDCVEEVKRMGFDVVPLSKEQDSLIYQRENQYVAREIWKFKKTV